MTSIITLQDAAEREFREKIKCPDKNCDGNGTACYSDRNGDPEPCPCQFCFEVRLPAIELLRSQIKKAVEEENQACLDGERCERCGVEKENDLSTICAKCFMEA